MLVGITQSYKARCLSMLFIAWAIGHADRILMSIAIVPVSEEYALNAAQAGLVLSIFYVAYAPMQLVGGWLADRFGSRSVIVGCVLLWSIFTGLTSLAWSFYSLLAIRFFFGAGEGAFSPASSVTIAETFPKHERSRAKSLLISTVFLGAAAGAGVVGGTIALFGWRASFHILALAGVVVAAGLWITLKPQKREKSLETKVSWLSLVRTPMLQKLMGVWLFTSMLYVGIQSWLPTYLTKTFGISLGEASFAALVPNIVAFLGTNLVGTLLDKYGSGKERLFMAAGAAGCGIALALMMTAPSLSVFVFYWTCCLVSYNFVYSTVFAAPLRHFPDHLIGSATGIMNFGGQIAGAIAPAAMGFLILATGGSYDSALLLLVFSAAMASLIALTWIRPAGVDAHSATP